MTSYVDRLRDVGNKICDGALELDLLIGDINYGTAAGKEAATAWRHLNSATKAIEAAIKELDKRKAA